MANTPFAERLEKWRTDLLHKERAALLGVELETFRNWLYGKNEPSELAIAELERRMAQHANGQ